MKTSELRALTAAKLNTKLVESVEAHIVSRQSLAAGELLNPRIIRNQRREIAQLKTVIAEQIADSNNKKENENV